MKHHPSNLPIEFTRSTQGSLEEKEDEYKLGEDYFNTLQFILERYRLSNGDILEIDSMEKIFG